MTDLAISNRLYHGNLVAGAAAEGHGALTDWHGRGSRTIDAIRQAVGSIVPSDWLPSPKDAPVQLGRAMQACTGQRYVAKPVRKSADPAQRALETWLARWVLVTMPVGSQVRAGDAVGNIALVATLEEKDGMVSLSCSVQGSEDPDIAAERSKLCEMLRTNYHALVGQQVLQASDITRWLGLTLRNRLACVRYGRSYYIPAETRETAEALVNALRSDNWGQYWMYPALPVATTAQLSLGLAMGLALDVNELAEDFGLARDAARAEGKLDVGPRALQSAKDKLDVIRARVNFYASRLGEARSEVDEPIRDLTVVFEEVEQNHARAGESS